MFDKMADNEVAELGRCLKGVVEAAAEGGDPGELIAKAAEARGYGVEKTARLCEAFNKASAVRELVSRPLGKKAEDISLVDTKSVLERLLGFNEKEAEDKLDPLPDLSRADIDGLSKLGLKAGLDKLAADKVGHQISDASRFMADWRAGVRSEHAEKEARMAGMVAEEDARETLRDFGNAVRSEPGFIAKHASDVAARHGEPGKILMKMAAAMSGQPEPVFHRGGSLPVPGRLGVMVESIMEKRASLDKEAGVMTALPFALASNLKPSYKEEVHDDDFDLSATGRKYRKLDLRLSEELARVDKFRQLMLLYRSDPYFHGKSVQDVMEAFDFATQQLPHVHPIGNKDLFSQVMRKRMQAGPAGVDLFDIKQLADLDKTKADSDLKAIQATEAEGKRWGIASGLAPSKKDVDMLTPLQAGAKGVLDTTGSTLKSLLESTGKTKT